MSDTYCSHIPDTTHHSGSFNSIGHPLWHGTYLYDEIHSQWHTKKNLLDECSQNGSLLRWDVKDEVGIEHGNFIYSYLFSSILQFWRSWKGKIVFCVNFMSLVLKNCWSNGLGGKFWFWTSTCGFLKFWLNFTSKNRMKVATIQIDSVTNEKILHEIRKKKKKIPNSA